MQLIWVSGPTGKVVTLAITFRRVVAGLVVLCLAMLLIGTVLNVLGLRIAVDVSPQFVHRIGGVSSVDDHRRMEEGYQAKLSELQSQLGTLREQYRAVERSRREVVGLLGIRDLLADAPAPERRPQASALAKGGPLRLLDSLPWAMGLESHFSRAQQDAERMSDDMQWLRSRLDSDLERLLVLPVTMPLTDAFLVSSGFGVRPDPFNGQRSMHDGVDFIAPRGTTVVATAPGRVVRSEHLPDWGNLVEVAHAHGFLTRYAHLDRRAVQAGEQVERGTLLGTLGNTGRSTGPHLHYEIARDGRTFDPAKAVPGLARPQ